MLDIARSRGALRRVTALALGALTLFGFTLVATPASAAPPTSAENFSPNTDVNDSPNVAGEETTLMADRNDGTNTSYHVNTVASLDTSSVDWYYCPSAYDGAGDPTAVGSGCTLAGSDNSGEQPAGGTGEAYEMDFNVPDDGVHDWVAWFCSTTPKTTANCAETFEDDVQFDDASTGTPESQSPAGELTLPPNPANVSNTGFPVTATTDPSVTQVGWCVDQADAADPPDNTCDDTDLDSTPDNPAQQQSQFKTWSGFLIADPNQEHGVTLYETMGGATSPLTTNCTGDTLDCALDSHYIASTPPAAASIEIAFPNFGEPSTTPNDCGDPNAVNTAIDSSPSFNKVQGCIFDQSGNFATDSHDWAFQLTPEDPNATSTNPLGFGQGGFTAEGDENDTNANNTFEQVDGDPGQSGDIAEQDFQLQSNATYNFVFCRDSDDNADDFASQSATPCSGESLSASGTFTVQQAVDHVHVKKEGTEGPQCHTGSSSTTAPAGSNVTLVGCALGVTSSGAEQAAVGEHVLWFVNPANQPQDPGQIVSQQNTTTAQGKANAVVTSGGGAAEKTSTIRFCLDEFPATGGATAGNGICDSFESGRQPNPALQADFQINWTRAAGGPGPGPRVGRCPNGLNKIRGSSGDDELKGTRDCDRMKGRAGDDDLSARAGDDVLVGGSGFDRCFGGPGRDRFRGCEIKKQGGRR